MAVTKERRAQLKAERHLKWLQSYTISNKFLADKKYYKNNYWSVAHFQSWAAQGKAGSCPCGCGWYDHTLVNRRAANKFCKQVTTNFCSDCARKIEEIIGHKFNNSFCP